MSLRNLLPTLGDPRLGNKEGGFTLIELIVVLALMGILLGFSIPRISSSFFVDETKSTLALGHGQSENAEKQVPGRAETVYTESEPSTTKPCG